ncbi:hypothetical protein BDF21DRAFT_410782 [Thamnidium elegans]|nr:hypothetical protein BDF21DRAFT_410782 [Thamnidium elegans]
MKQLSYFIITIFFLFCFRNTRAVDPHTQKSTSLLLERKTGAIYVCVYYITRSRIYYLSFSGQKKKKKSYRSC